MQFGPYEVIRELGRGGMGVVYLARHSALGREFALKTLQAADLGSDGSGAEPELLARFVREARAAARLAGDPGVVAVHDVGEHGGVPYLAMDYVPGGDLRELIDAGDVAPDETLRIMELACRAVHRAHLQGVLHRDLKPENILLDADGDPRVTDYGLAKLHELDADSRKLTRTGALLGTVGYMAPEQLLGEAADARSDVHALGVCLYELATGRSPYDGDSTATVLNNVMRVAPCPPRMHRAGLSKDLEAVILRALAKQPRDRFQTAEELADEIARARAGAETLTRPIGPVGRLVRILQAQPGLILLGFVVAAMGVTATVLSLRGDEQAVTERQQLVTAKGDAAAFERGRVSETAYRALLQAVRADLLLLEDAFHGNRDAQARAEAAVQRVRAAAAAAEADFHGAAAPQAVVLLAERYAGREEASNEISALADAQKLDPFPRLFHAQARWSEYTEALQLPGMRIGIGGVVLQQFAEPAGARELRERVQATLRKPEWLAQMPKALGPWARWGEAARLLGEENYAAAERALAGLGDEPLLEHGALFLRGVALMMLRREADAAVVLERAGSRGWQKALKLAGAARLSQALGAGPGARGSGEAMDRAQADYAEALRLDGGDLEATLNLAVTRVAAVVAGFETGHDAGARFQEGLAAMSAVIAAHPGRTEARRLRGGTYLYLARAEQDGGRDPRDQYRAALADLEASAPAPHEGWVWYGSGLVHYELARAESMAGQDPSAGYARALQALERGFRDASVRSDVLGVRGLVRLAQAEMEAAARRDTSQLLRQAEQDFDRAIELAPGSATPLRIRASATAQLAGLTEFSGGDPLPVYRRAVDDLTRALDLLPGIGQMILNRGNFHMIIGDALTDAGKPGAPAAYEASAADYRRAVEAAPQDWQALANLGVALGRLDRWAEAIEPLERAVQLAPGNSQLQAILADALRLAGK